MRAVTTKPQVLGSRKDIPEATPQSLVETSRAPLGVDAREPYSPSTHAITCISCSVFENSDSKTGQQGQHQQWEKDVGIKQARPYACVLWLSMTDTAMGENEGEIMRCRLTSRPYIRICRSQRQQSWWEKDVGVRKMKALWRGRFL